MADARQILQPRFAYYKEIDTESRLESVILKTASKDAIRISAGVVEHLSDFENYQKENTHAKIEHSKDLYGIFGIVKRQNCEYVLLAEEASLMGPILRCNIYRVDQILVIPLQNQKSIEDSEFLGYIENLVKDKSFYFSYNYNLTRTLQYTVNKVVSNEEEKNESGLEKKGSSSLFWDQYETRFLFNRALFTEWDNNANEHLWQFLVPVVYGYVFIHSVNFDNKKAEYTLLSKKDCSRLGRRFVSRGLDSDGNASNFVETEHIIVYYEQETYKVASYVQTRGSIPLFWTQTPTLKYEPVLKVEEDMKKNIKAAEKHFNRTIEKYGENVLVNLIDKKGAQNRIGEKFTELVKTLNHEKITYVWFDFHHECRKMKYENLSKLVDKIKEKIDSFDYFMAHLDYGLNEKSKLGRENCKIM